MSIPTSRGAPASNPGADPPRIPGFANPMATSWGSAVAAQWGRPWRMEGDQTTGKFYLRDSLDLPGDKFDRDILIREEYTKAFEHLEALKTRSSPGSGYQRPPRVIVSGSPGIGKTMFLGYVIIERISRGLPTAIQFDRDFFLLFENGKVWAYPTTSAAAHRLSKDVWALFDSDVDMHVPCPAFRSSKAMIVMASSPQSRRWDRFQKEYYAEIYIMDVWTEAELKRLFHHTYPSQVSRGLELARRWGPSPRCLLEILRKEDDLKDVPNSSGFEEAHRNRVKIAAAKFVRQGMDFLTELEGLDFGSEVAPSSLFFVRPTVPNKRVLPKVSLPTRTLSAELDDATQRLTAVDRQRFFTNLQYHQATHQAAGWMLERRLHAWLQNASTTLKCHRQHASEIALSPSPAQTVLVGTVERLQRVQEPFYWRPSASNFPGIDSVLFTGTATFLIQVALSETHKSPVDGIKAVQNAVTAAVGNKPWHIVVVGTELRRVERVRRKIVLPAEMATVKTWACELRLEEQPLPETLIQPGDNADAMEE